MDKTTALRRRIGCNFRKGHSHTPGRLHFEHLEPRTVLSAFVPVVPVFAAHSSAAPSPAVFDAGSMARLDQSAGALPFAAPAGRQESLGPAVSPAPDLSAPSRVHGNPVQTAVFAPGTSMDDPAQVASGGRPDGSTPQYFPPSSRFLMTVEYALAPQPWIDSSGPLEIRRFPVPEMDLSDFLAGSDDAGVPVDWVPGQPPAPFATNPAANGGPIDTAPAIASQALRPVGQEATSTELSIASSGRAARDLLNTMSDSLSAVAARTAYNDAGGAPLAASTAMLQGAQEAGAPGSAGLGAPAVAPGRAAEGFVNWQSGPQPSGSSNATEGGLVEFDTLPPRASQSSSPPLQEPSWNSEEPASPLPRLAQDGTANDSRDAGTDASNDSPSVGQPGDESRDIAQLPRAGEGGMLELAAVSPAQDVAAAPGIVDRAADPRPLATGGKIRLDNEVGLFQAFEVGTMPREDADNIRPVSAETTQLEPPVTAAPVATPHSPPTAWRPSAANDPGGRSVHAASIAPALVLASSLAAIDAVHAEKPRYAGLLPLRKSRLRSPLGTFDRHSRL
jgi:hypothetical protein